MDDDGITASKNRKFGIRISKNRRLRFKAWLLEADGAFRVYVLGTLEMEKRRGRSAAFIGNLLRYHEHHWSGSAGFSSEMRETGSAVAAHTHTQSS